MTHSTMSPRFPKMPQLNNQSSKAHSAPSRVKNRAKAVGARLFSVLFWLIAWHAGSLALGQSIILVSPVTAAKTLFQMMGTAEFYQAVFGSLSRILLGFFAGVLLGTLLAALSYRLPPAGALLAPLMHAIKATPVASFVILALIFISSRYLSILMGFLMVLPILYTNVLTGLRGTDKKLIEMAKVFRMKPLAKFRAIYLPAAYPNFLSSCALALGMSWKAGIAAEVIGLPDQSIGEALYQAKIFFSTPEMYAWTLAIILMSVALEKAVMYAAKALSRRLDGGV